MIAASLAWPERSSVRRRVRSLAKDAYHRLGRRPSAGPVILVVLGCQRSGTSMMLRTLDEDWNAKVFDEFASVNVRAGDRRSSWSGARGPYGIRLLPLDELAPRLQGLPYRLVALKPLAESQRAPELLERLEGARCIWMYRHYRDVSHSIARKFSAEVHRVNLQPIVDREQGNWRSELVPEDVRATVARHYSRHMNPYDGGALFWYVRNRLYFDLDLARHPAVMLLSYQELVRAPEAVLERVYGFAAVPFPGPRIARDIHNRALGMGHDVPIAPEIEALCEDLWRRLDVADRQSEPRGTRADLPRG